MTQSPEPGFRDQFPRLPNPRFIGVLIVVAALVLGVGASLRPRSQPAAVVVPTNELATLPERFNRRFPDLAPLVTTVVLAGVTIFELVGPIGARYVLIRAGESRSQPPATGLVD